MVVVASAQAMARITVVAAVEEAAVVAAVVEASPTFVLKMYKHIMFGDVRSPVGARLSLIIQPILNQTW